MFNFTLFGLLIALSLPGIILVVPRLIQRQMAFIQANVKPGQTVPSQKVIVLVGIIQNLIIIAIPAAIGVALTARVGLAAPILTTLLAGEPIWPQLQPQLMPMLLLTIGGAITMLGGYYALVRSRLDANTLQVIESQRMDLGLSGRLLYGGIVEEILARWGLMTLFIWLGSLIVGEVTAVIVWSSIILAGILFGLGHMPAILAAGAKKTAVLYIAAIGLNLWVSLIFGWLFWQHGLVAAILSHMLLHLIWYPIDRYFYQPTQIENASTTPLASQ